MTGLQDFERVEDRGVFRPVGTFSLQEVVWLVTSAITLAREAKIRKLMVVALEVTGFEAPSISDRYYFAQEWARAAGGIVRIVMVARPEMIDREKFGVTVAANNGLVAEVFPSEEEAVVWLNQVK